MRDYVHHRQKPPISTCSTRITRTTPICAQWTVSRSVFSARSLFLFTFLCAVLVKQKYIYMPPRRQLMPLLAHGKLDNGVRAQWILFILFALCCPHRIIFFFLPPHPKAYRPVSCVCKREKRMRSLACETRVLYSQLNVHSPDLFIAIRLQSEIE